MGVTSIAAPMDGSDTLLTGSRDRSVIQWDLSQKNPALGEAGVAKKRLDGHSNFVQDVQISSDSQFGLSASWDGSLRLWDLQKGQSTVRFVGHTKDVMSCAFSPDKHTDWVSCTRFSPNPTNALMVSCVARTG